MLLKPCETALPQATSWHSVPAARGVGNLSSYKAPKSHAVTSNLPLPYGCQGPRNPSLPPPTPTPLPTLASWYSEQQGCHSWVWDTRLHLKKSSQLSVAGANLLLFHSPVSILNFLYLVPLREVIVKFTSSERTVQRLPGKW